MEKTLKSFTTIVLVEVTKALYYVLTMYTSVVDHGLYVSSKTFTMPKLLLLAGLKVKANVQVLSANF